MKRLDGKVVIVTGAGKHLGQAYAERLGSEGAKVVVCDIAPCDETASLVKATGADVLALQTDVTSEDQVKDMVKETLGRFGRIDCLVNNAGIFDGLVIRPSDLIDMAEWDRVFNVNVRGMFLCCRAVIPVFRDQGAGKIINIGSGIFLSGTPGLPHYVASKAAVMGLTRSLAKELGHLNVTVNTLAPGGTNSGASLVVDPEMTPSPARPGRALNRPEVAGDITGTLVFLCSADSDFISGQMVVVNGGDALY